MAGPVGTIFSTNQPNVYVDGNYGLWQWNGRDWAFLGKGTNAPSVNPNAAVSPFGYFPSAGGNPFAGIQPSAYPGQQVALNGQQYQLGAASPQPSTMVAGAAPVGALRFLGGNRYLDATGKAWLETAPGKWTEEGSESRFVKAQGTAPASPTATPVTGQGLTEAQAMLAAGYPFGAPQGLKSQGPYVPNQGQNKVAAQPVVVDPAKPYKDLAAFYGIDWNVLKSAYLKDAPSATHSQIINGIESAWWDGQWAKLFASANNGRAPNETEWKEHYDWKVSGGKSRDPLLEPGHNAYMDQWNKLAMPNPPGTQAPTQIPLNGGSKGAVGDLAQALPKSPTIETPPAPVAETPAPYVPTVTPPAPELPYLPTLRVGEVPIAI